MRKTSWHIFIMIPPSIVLVFTSQAPVPVEAAGGGGGVPLISSRIMPLILTSRQERAKLGRATTGAET
jgi:hypothetical protein